MLLPRFVSLVRPFFRPATPRKTTLTLEMLEDRTTPTVAPNNLFVSSLYQGLLGRNADAGGLSYWTGQLNAGVSRTQVAQDIATSDEALNHDVRLFYDTLLNRPADADVSYWTDQLQGGATLDQVKAKIIGSDEFFKEAGSTNAGFVNALYHDELGRAPEPGGLTYWESQLNAGTSRTQVAVDVLSAPEASNEKTISFFNAALGHTPDAGGLNYWSAQLQAGTPETQVLAGILGSNEYFSHVQSVATTTPTTDPNQGAANMIGALNLFKGPLPNAEYLDHTIVDPQPPLPVGPPVDNTVVPSDGTNSDVLGAANNTYYTPPPLDTSYVPPYTPDTGYVDTTTTDNTYVDNSTPDYTTTDCGCGDTSAPDSYYVDPGSSDNSFVDPGFGN